MATLGNAAAAISYKDPGAYGLVWEQGDITSQGNITLSVTIDGEHVSGSPMWILSTFGPVVPANTLAYGNGLQGGMADTDISFILQTRDAYFNNLTSSGGLLFSVSLSSGSVSSELSGSVQDALDGTYTATYVATVAGSYTMTISNSDFQYLAQYTVQVGPGLLSAAAVTAEGTPSQLAGASVVYALQARDAYGNAFTSPTAFTLGLTIVKDSQNVEVAFNSSYSGSGRYDVAFVLTVAGTYSVSPLVDSITVKDSPFTTVISPGTKHAANCVVSGTGLGPLSAGTPARVAVQGVDAYGNPHTAGDTGFSATISDASGELCATDAAAAACGLSYTGSSSSDGEGSGGSWVDFTLTQAGSYQLELVITDAHTLDGNALGSSPSTVTVTADESGLPTLFTSSRAGVHVTAGELVNTTLQEQDGYGNARTTSGEAFAVLVEHAPSGATVPALSVSDVGGGAYVVTVATSRSGHFSLAVQYNLSSTGEGMPVVPVSAFNLSVAAGAISAAGTKRNSDRELALEWYGGDDQAFVDGFVEERMERVPQWNKFALVAGDEFGNQVSSGGEGALLAVAVTSEEGAHSAAVNVSDLGGGLYGVAFQTTRAGWYAASVQLAGTHVASSPFRVFVQAGVAESAESYACHHANGGCYGRDAGDAAATCAAWLQSPPAGMLFCSAASAEAPALAHVRMVDRYSNERSRARWEDFVVLNVSRSDAAFAASVFDDVGCFDGTYPCSAASNLAPALNVESLGYTVASQAAADPTVWLHAVSFVGTVSGEYKVDLQHGVLLADKTSRRIQGGISPSPSFTVQVLPAEPAAGLSLASGSGLTNTVAGIRTSFAIASWDKFGNARVGVVAASAAEAGGFECLFVGPDPEDQTLLFPGVTAPQFFGAVSGLAGEKCQCSAAVRTAALTCKRKQQDLTVEGASDGRFQVQYTPTISGEYKVYLRYSGEHLVGSPFNLTVEQSGAVANQSRILTGSPLPARAGVPANVMVQAYDLFGNRLELTADEAFVGSVPVPVTSSITTVDIGAGVYNISFVFTKSGSFQASIHLKGQHVIGSPVDVSVVSGYTDPTKSLINASDIAGKGTAGVAYSFKIHTFDQFYNPRHEGQESFDVGFTSPVYNDCASCSSCDFLYLNQNFSIDNRHCTGPGASLAACDSCGALAATAYDLADSQVCTSLGLGAADEYCRPGIYLVWAVLTKSGSYMVGVDLAGLPVADTPFVATVTANEPYAPFSTIEETNVSLTMATAGVAHNFVLESYDQWLNPKDAADSAVVFQLQISDYTNQSIRDVQSSNLGGGRFAIDYLLTVAGRYTAEVSIMGEGTHIRGSPFRFRVFPNIFNAPTSTGTDSGFSLSTAGVVTTFQIITRDRFLNPKTSGAGEAWEVSVSHGERNISVDASVVDLNDGRFQVAYLLTQSATYTLSATSQLLPLLGTPSNVTVIPNSAAPEKTRVVGSGASEARAGLRASFLIHTADSFGNLRSVGGADFSFQLVGGWTQAADGSVRTVITVQGEVQDLRNGSYVGSYLTTRAGVFTLNVRLRVGGEDVAVANSPFLVQVGAAELAVTECTPFGIDIATRPAGLNRMQMLAKDAYGNPFTRPTQDATSFKLQLDGLQIPIVGSVQDGTSGSYDLAYVATIAGMYRVSITNLGVHVSTSPFDLEISPGAAHVPSFLASFPTARHCTPALGCQWLERVTTAGDPKFFSVFAKDQYGNQRSSVDVALTVTISGVAERNGTSIRSFPGNVTDEGFGLLSLAITPTISGEYQVHVQERETNVAMSGSPFSFLTVAAVVYAPNCHILGSGQSLGQSGEDTTFTIQAVDAYGNDRKWGVYDDSRQVFNGEFFRSNIDIVGPGPFLDLVVTDTKVGKYEVTYQVTTTGTYSVNVFKMDNTQRPPVQIHISGSPFNTGVVPGPASALTAVIYASEGTSLANAIAGRFARFHVQSFDRYGNQRTTGGDPLSGDVKSLRTREFTEDITVDCQVTDHGFGNYTLAYMVTLSSQYMLSVYMDGKQVGAARELRSPIRIVCSPNSLDPRQTDVSGEGASFSTVNRESMFLLQPRDSYGNTLGIGTNSVDITLCTGDVSACVNIPTQVSLRLSFFNHDTQTPFSTRFKFSQAPSRDDGSAEPVPVDIRQVADGSFGVYFRLLEQGNYSAFLEVKGVPIKGSPLTVGAFPEDLDPLASNCGLTLEELEQTAGNLFVGLLRMRNQYRVPLGYVPTENVQVEIVEPVQHELELQNRMDGTFSLQIRFTRSGDYTLQVRVLQSAIHGSPFSLHVLPNEPEPSTSEAFYQEPVAFAAGTQVSFTVQTGDRFGNAHTPESYPLYSPSSLSARLRRADGTRQYNGNVIDLETGMYEVVFGSVNMLQVTFAGKYQVIATDAGSGVGKTPFTLTVTPNDVSAAHSFLSEEIPDANTVVSELAIGNTAGQETEIYLKPRDTFGNPWTAQMFERIEVFAQQDINGTDTSQFRATWAASFYAGAGDYGLKLASTKAGNYFVDVQLSSMSVANAPFKFFVDPGPAVGELSYLAKSVPTDVAAGDEIYFEIQPVDKYQNLHTRDMGAAFAVTAKGLIYVSNCKAGQSSATHDCVDVQSTGGSTIAARFSLVRTGQHVVEVQLRSRGNGLLEAVSGQPWRVMVHPGALSPPMSTARGAGAEAFVAGETVLFLILARDKFGNTLSTGGANVTARIERQVEALNSSGVANVSGAVHDIYVEDNQDGSYLASYRLTVAGAYHITVHMNDALALGGPVEVQGSSAATASEATSGLPLEYVDGVLLPVAPQASLSTAGITGTFTFWARDMFSNRLSAGGDQFDLQIIGPSSAQVEVIDNADGSYVAQYLVPLRGVYSLSLRLRGIHVGVLWSSGTTILGSPLRSFRVIQAESPFTQVAVFGDGLLSAVVAESATFTIDSRDSVAQDACCCAGSTCSGWVVELQARTDSGIKKTCDECTLSGAVSPRKPGEDQTSAVTFVTSRKGLWTISVYSIVQDLPIHAAGSPFSLQVLPGPADVSKTQVSGAGLVGCVLNTEAEIVVTTMDAFSNSRTDASLLDDVQVYLVNTTAQGQPPPLIDRSTSGIHGGKFQGVYCGCLGLIRFCSGCSCVTPGSCQAGLGAVNVIVNTQHIPGSPFPISIVAETGDAVAAKSDLINGFTMQAMAGKSLQVLVRARDSSGFNILTGGSAVTAMSIRRDPTKDAVATERLPVLDLEDGRYEITFSPTQATPHALWIKLDGEPLLTSENASALGGTDSTISMSYDSESTDRFYVDYSLYIWAGTASGQIATITDFKGVPRRASAPFVVAPDASSEYLVTPYRVVVQPAAFLPERSVVACNITTGIVASGLEVFAEEGSEITAGALITDDAQCGLSSSMASSQSEFFILLRDEFSNVLTSGIDTSRISVRVEKGAGVIEHELFTAFCSDRTKATDAQCSGRKPLYLCEGPSIVSPAQLHSDEDCGRTCHASACSYRAEHAREWRESGAQMLVSYASTSTGQYSIAVSIDDVRILRTTRTVTGSIVEPDTAEVTGTSLTGVEAGQIATFVVSVSDRFGNRPCESGPSCVPPPLLAIGVDNGVSVTSGVSRYVGSAQTYLCSYNTTVAGFQTLTVKLFGYTIGRGQYPLYIAPGDASSRRSTVQTSARYVAGTPGLLYIDSKDRYKNQRTIGGDEFQVFLSQPFGEVVTGSLVDHRNGSYLGALTTTMTGVFRVLVNLGLEEVSTFEVEVVAAEPSGSTTDVDSSILSILRAGTRVPIHVQMRDEYFNLIRTCNGTTLHIAITISRTDFFDTVAEPTRVIRCSNGTFDTTIEFTVAGFHDIDISINGNDPIIGSPFSTRIVSSFVDATKSFMESLYVGDDSVEGGSIDAEAGTPSQMMLFARDSYGNKVQYDPFAEIDEFTVFLAALGTRCVRACPSTCDVFTGEPVDPAFDLCLIANVTNNFDSTYSVAWTPTVAEKYQVVTNLRGVGIMGSPFFALVGTGPVSPLDCEVYGLRQALKAGTSIAFVVESRDSYQNRITVGGAPFSARLSRRNADFAVSASAISVLDCASGDCGNVSALPGMYEGAYFVTFAAQYSLHIDHGGYRVSGSPYTIQVQSVDFAVSACTLQDPGSWGGVSGTDSTFTIVARDVFGNQLTKGGNSFTVHLFNGGGVDRYVIPSDVGDGSYKVTYSLQDVGDYTLEVTSSSEHIAGSPVYPLPIVAEYGFWVPSKSLVTGNAIYGLQAGAVGIVTLQIRDGFGMPATVGGQEVDGSMQRASGVDVSYSLLGMIDNRDGTFSAQLSQQVVGTYNTIITLTSSHVLGSPFSTQIVPGDTSPRHSYVWPEVASEIGSVAGQRKTFYIQAMDGYQNLASYDDFVGEDQFSAQLLPNGGATQEQLAIPCDIFNNRDGTYRASYTSTVAGRYILAVDLRTRSQPTVPSEVTRMSGINIAAARTNPDASSINWGAGGSLIAGRFVTFGVTARDAFYNVVQDGLQDFQVRIESSRGGFEIDLKEQSADFEYVFEYFLTITGKYTLFVQYDNADIPGSPRQLVVEAAELDTTTTALVDELPLTMLAGQAMDFTLQSKDAFSNHISEGQKAFKAVMSGPSSTKVTVVDQFDGQYALTVPALATLGSYQLYITRGGTHVSGSPYEVEIFPGTVSPTSSLVDTSRIRPLYAGQQAVVLVQAWDGFGNRITRGDDVFVASVTGSSIVSTQVNDLRTGTYEVTFLAFTAGPYTLEVTLNQQRVEDKVFSFEVLPAAVQALSSVAFGSGLSNALAGSLSELYAITRDGYGNANLFSDALVRVEMTDPDSEKVSRTLDYNGVDAYYYSSLVTRAGQYQVDVRLTTGGDTAFLASQVRTVLPAAADTTSCLLEAPAAGACKAGAECEFALYGKDRYGNRMTESGETFAVRMVSDEAALPLLTVEGIATSPLDNGVYSLLATPTRSGMYRLLVTRYENHVAGSEVRMEVVPGAAVAGGSTAEGFGLLGGLVAEPSSFTVQSRDIAGNAVEDDVLSLTVKVTAVDTATVLSQVFIAYQGQGAYLVMWTPSSAGYHQIEVASGSEPIAGSPFTNVNVIAIDETTLTTVVDRFCTAEGTMLTQAGIVDVSSSFIVTPRNYAGTQVTDTNVLASTEFVVTLDNELCPACPLAPLTGTVTKACCMETPVNGVGDVKVWYISREAGNSFFRVYLNEFDNQIETHEIYGSPFEVWTLATETYSNTSALEPMAGMEPLCSRCTMTVTEAGLPFQLQVVIRDRFGNVVPGEGASRVQLSVDGDNPSEMTITDNWDGVVSVSILQQVSGTYKLSVLVTGEPVVGSPFDLSVVPASASALQSEAFGSALDPLATAGVPTSLRVVARDEFLNLQAQDKVLYRVTFDGVQSYSVPLAQVDGADYVVSLATTIAGQYSMSVLLVTEHIAGSPFSISVTSSDVYAPNCMAAGYGVRTGVAGTTSTFAIHARDIYMNTCTKTETNKTFGISLVAHALESPDFLHRADPECGGRLTCSTELTTPVTVNAFYSYDPDQERFIAEYTALMPGTYVVVIDYGGEPIAKVLGDPCNATCASDLCTSCADVVESRPPGTTSAVFSDSAGRLVVQFHDVTNRAGQFGLFNCSTIIAAESLFALAAPGFRPSCTFIDEQTLEVYLAFGATIRVNDDLVFTDPDWGVGGVRHRPRCRDALCFQTSRALLGGVRVDRPDSPVRPVAILKGPSVVGPCDDLLLDASSSYGSGGRQMQFFFGLEPGTPNDAEVRRFILDASVPPYDANKLVIPSRLLLTGVRYQFLVRILNFIDEFGESTLAVTKTTRVSPLVSIEGPNERGVHRAEAFKLRGDFSLSACSRLQDKTVDFVWSLFSAEPALPEALVLDDKTRNTRSLFIPASALIEGTTYVFQLQATMRANTSQVGTQTVVINCLFPPFFARIDGSDRTWILGTELELMVQESDAATATGNWPTSYTWSCETAAGSACLDETVPALLVDAPTLRLDTSLLTTGTYVFRVIIVKEPGPRQASASVTIWIVPGIIPSVEIAPITVRKVNPGDRLALTSTVSGTGASKTTWSQVSGDDVLLYPEMISTELWQKHLVVRDGVLSSGQIYSFRVTAVDSTGAVGFSELTFRVNTPPTSGACAVSPTVGTAVTDSFRLECQDWVDDGEDLPLRYVHRYRLQSAPADEVPLGAVDKNVFETSLPGPKGTAPEHQLTVISYVFDQAGASASSAHRVTVRAGVGRRSLEGLARLDDCVATQDVECIIQLTIALSQLQALACADKAGMLRRLRNAAALVHMNSVEVAGFASAVRETSAAPCLASNSTRRALATAELDDSLALVGTLVSTSQDTGLDPVATSGLGNSLSTALDSLADINHAVATVRRVLALESPRAAAPGHSFRRRGPSRGGVQGAFAGSRRASSATDQLLGSLSGLSESMLNGAVPGEAGVDLVTESIAMGSQNRLPEGVGGSNLVPPVQGRPAPAFQLPSNVLGRRRAGAGEEGLSVQVTGMRRSPFESGEELTEAGVASLALAGVEVADLVDPIELVMPADLKEQDPADGVFDLWTEVNSLVDVSTETCQYWNFETRAWDGFGCIVSEIKETQETFCHCYHLTDFGGVKAAILPKMNIPDPTNPGAILQNISADNVFVFVMLGFMVIIYAALCYWGWRKDRQEAELGGLGQREKKYLTDEAAINDAITANNAKLTKQLLRGSKSKKLLMLRDKMVQAVVEQHKLIGPFFARRSMYTRPRRFTVLFCMLLGNMVIIALWTASGPQNFFQKIVGGVISAILMFPASFFFAWIFKKLDSTPDVKKGRNQDNQEQKMEKTQEVLKPLKKAPPTVDKDGNPLSAPPDELKDGKKLPKKRGFIPLPNRTRMGMPEGPQQIFKRTRHVTHPNDPDPASSTADPSASPRPPPTPPPPQPPTIREEEAGAPEPPEELHPVERRAMAGSTSAALDLHSRLPPLPPLGSSPPLPDADVGQFIPRRALPILKDPHHPAPVPVRRNSDGSAGKPGSSAGSRSSQRRHSTASTSPLQPQPPAAAGAATGDTPRPPPPPAPSSQIASENPSRVSGESKRRAWEHDVVAHDDEKDLHGQANDVMPFDFDDDDDGPKAKRKGVAGILLGALDKPIRGLPKRQTFIDHRFEIAAYCLAFTWYMFCIYFCILFGVSFPRSLQDAWMLGFVISIIQDLLVMETLKLGSQTGLQLFVKPQLVGWLAERAMKERQAA